MTATTWNLEWFLRVAESLGRGCTIQFVDNDSALTETLHHYSLLRGCEWFVLGTHIKTPVSNYTVSKIPGVIMEAASQSCADRRIVIVDLGLDWTPASFAEFDTFMHECAVVPESGITVVYTSTSEQHWALRPKHVDVRVSSHMTEALYNK